jgi:hypothetical protein
MCSTWYEIQADWLGTPVPRGEACGCLEVVLVFTRSVMLVGGVTAQTLVPGAGTGEEVTLALFL